MAWREEISPHLKPFIEKLISESMKEKSLHKSQSPSKAQLWIAMGILAKHAYDLELKTNYLERALKDISPRTKTENTLKAEAEVEKIISDIAGGKYNKKKKSRVRTNF